MTTRKFLIAHRPNVRDIQMRLRCTSQSLWGRPRCWKKEEYLSLVLLKINSLPVATGEADGADDQCNPLDNKDVDPLSDSFDIAATFTEIKMQATDICQVSGPLPTRTGEFQVCPWSSRLEQEDPSIQGFIALSTSGGHITQRFFDAKLDCTSLGRWVSLKFRGVPGKELLVIATRILCVDTSLGSVYNQQQAFFNAHPTLENDGKNAGEICIQDLCEYIKEQRRPGEEVILMLDASGDIHDGDVATSLQELDMVDLPTLRSNSLGEQETAPMLVRHGMGIFV
jgi:hypothetical protein